MSKFELRTCWSWILRRMLWVVSPNLWCSLIFDNDKIAETTYIMAGVQLLMAKLVVICLAMAMLRKFAEGLQDSVFMIWTMLLFHCLPWLQVLFQLLHTQGRLMDGHLLDVTMIAWVLVPFPRRSIPLPDLQWASTHVCPHAFPEVTDFRASNMVVNVTAITR